MDKNIMLRDPKVTVLMPVYNGEKYLREAVNSILTQTFVDFEFLIINDGSTDKSVEIVQSYADSRIRLVHNEKNLGLIATLNKGLDLASGEYIARMDCDDISLPSRLAVQVKFLNQHPFVMICGTWGSAFGSLKFIMYPPVRHEEIQCELIFDSALIHPSVMIRKNVLLCGNFVYQEESAEDYDLWARISDTFILHNIPKILLRYRVHPKSISCAHRIERTSGADRARKMRLQRLNPLVSDEECRLHSSIARCAYVESIDDLRFREAWLLKLLKWNQSKKVYNQKVFGEAVSRRWFWACLNAKFFSRSYVYVLELFFDSPLSCYFGAILCKKGRDIAQFLYYKI